MNSSNDLTTSIGAIVAIVSGFGVIAKIMLNQASKDREADRKERQNLASAIATMAENSGKVAEATVRSADEAKERNGHLAELVVQGTEMTKTIADKMPVQTIQEQHIGTQVVGETQVVPDRRKKK